MDINNNSLPRSRYPYLQNHYHSQLQRSALPIDVQAIVAGVQRYPIPQTYIPLPPGVDPASVDYRTFFPYNPSEVKHRKRTTRSQLKVLEDTFKQETKPNATLRKSLAAQLEMTPRGVQVWFQNRRAKEKALAKKVSSSDKRSMYDRDADCDGFEDDDDDETIPVTEQEGIEKAALSAMQSSQESGQTVSNDVQSLHLQATKSASADQISVVTQDISVSGEFESNSSSLGTPQTPWQSAELFAEPSINARTSNVSNIDLNSIVNLRRGSLPTHIGMRTGFEGGAGLPPSSYRPRSFVSGINGSVGPGGLIGFDPLARRLSLDRLASHPYARVALAANTAVYGPTCTRAYSYPRLSMSTRTQSQVAQTNIREHGLYDDTSRSDFTQRAPVNVQHFEFQGQTGSHSPDDRIVYTSTRAYQEPIPGPLPEPNFSFGSVQIPSSMDADDNINKYGNFTYRENGDLEDVDEDQISAHNFYSRFGSMASIADSESSSVGHHFTEGISLNTRRLSCNGQMLDMFTHLGVENGSNPSLEIGSRVNGPDMGVSSNTSVNIENSRETPGDYSSPSSSTVSGGSNDNNSVPISQSSELTFALQHVQEGVDDRQNRSIVSDGLHDVVPSELNPAIDTESQPFPSFQNSHRSSMSSSGSSIIYPLSASSSQTSLSLLPPRAAVDMPDNFLFDDGIDVVSGTGHYSPVVTSFDFSQMPMEAQHTFPSQTGTFVIESDSTGHHQSYQFTPDTQGKSATTSFAPEACGTY